MTLAADLVAAEERLRQHGWTGGRAFDELIEALKDRLGLAHRASPEAAAVVADLPLDTGEDLLGLAYERFFADLFKGRRGQFFTPEPVARLLVSRLSIQPGEVVLDPTCGSGGLLVHAARAGGLAHGIELDPRLAALAQLNAKIAGLDVTVRQGDFFRTRPVMVDVVVANPPFSVPVRDPTVLQHHGLGGSSVQSDVLFLHTLSDWVLPGGRAGVVLPWSLLVNERFRGLRGQLAQQWSVLGVCQLPEGVFRPFGGAAGRAGVVWLRRGDRVDETEGAWFASVADPGYDVRSVRYVATDAREIDERCAGLGWVRLPQGAWVPAARGGSGRTVGSLATVRTGRCRPDAEERCHVVDLADADRSTGEVHPRPIPHGEVGARIAIEPADVLVARLRPNLGNVARAPAVDGVLAGSPEWVVLTPQEHGGWLLHALRSPVFREALPVTGGQTRPRTHPDAVTSVRLPWPGEALAARVDRLSTRIFAERAALRERMLALQHTVDQFVGGETTAEGLQEALGALERRYPGGDQEEGSS